ncbi:MAG: PLP-dependent aminotransferase family protein [Lachnospiraceae bacterium]|nr:PLP-dependent aminotransferase family protein [Lachnospiraceae bacterium]
MTELNIPLSGGQHLYEEIYEYIRDAIRSGELKKGEKLPSSRSLATSLSVSRSTVMLAYDQLLSEGYIEARQGSGCYVCGLDGLYLPGAELAAQQVSTALTSGSARASSTHREAKSDLTQRTSDSGNGKPAAVPAASDQIVIDFSLRRIDMTGFPYAVWRRLNRLALMDANADLFSPGPPEGDPALREEIAKYLHFSRGVVCRADQIIVGAGNEYLLMLLHQILGEGRIVALENPTYKKALRILKSMGFATRTVGMDENGMRVSDLEKSGADLAYVMPAHQFPTGTVLSYTRRMELLKWADSASAAEMDRYIIEDDYDSEFRFRGRPIPALQAQDRTGRVIYMGTFSKSIAPAIRISYMVLPERLLAKYDETCGFLNSTVSRIDQAILTAFLKEGHFERHLNRMRARYRARQEVLLKALAPFEERFEIGGQDTGLYLLLRERGYEQADESEEKITARERELTQLAAGKGIAVYPMYLFRTEGEKNPEGQRLAPTILLGFAALPDEDLIQGARLLAEALLID